MIIRSEYSILNGKDAQIMEKCFRRVLATSAAADHQ